MVMLIKYSEQQISLLNWL